MSKQYLDYEGLKFYTEQLKAWVLAQIAGAGSITPAEVDAKIAAAIAEASKSLDDTKVYATKNLFPAVGEEDIIYIAQDTGFQYVWDTSAAEGAGDYEILAEPIDPEDISHIIHI